MSGYGEVTVEGKPTLPAGEYTVSVYDAAGGTSVCATVKYDIGGGKHTSATFRRLGEFDITPTSTGMDIRSRANA